MKNRLKIEDIKVKSFVTQISENKEKTVKGGGHCGASNDRTACRACVSGHPVCNCN